MQNRTAVVSGRRIRYALSDNPDRSSSEDGFSHAPVDDAALGIGARDTGTSRPPVWAVNVHGYLSGGAMYWRECALMADALGWRVIAPSLPGFGGSDPLPDGRLTLQALADQIELVLEHLEVGPVVVLGHSMGAAVAAQYAFTHRSSTLGLILRDAVATPAWKAPRGPMTALLGAISPDLAQAAALWSSVAVEVPDLLVGRPSAMARSMLPDLGLSLWSTPHTMPVARLLADVDLTTELRELHRSGVPILTEWGCFDRVVGPAAAADLARAAGTEVVWVPGGHSWMVARPSGQADILRYVESGRRFVADLERRRHLSLPEASR
jgi:pimeloyl-ACP methyl ester carboxylesterase